MARHTVLFIVAVFLFAPTGALAAGNVEAQVCAAKKACLSGDTRKGTEILADLFIDTNDANHIFNQGRCYEQNGEKSQAIPRSVTCCWPRRQNQLAIHDLRHRVRRRGKHVESQVPSGGSR